MPDRPRHFRGKRRLGRRVEVRYQVREQDAAGPEQVAFTQNISIGGAFVATQDPPPIGSVLSVTLSLPEGEGKTRPMTVEAEVRWIADSDEDPADHGMGLRFRGLSVDEVRALNDWLSSLPATLDHDDL